MTTHRLGGWDGTSVWGAGVGRPGGNQGPEQRAGGGWGALKGLGAERAGESEAGVMSNFVSSHQSILFSNKSTEHQYKLNNEVQYTVNLTQHKDRTAQTYLCAKIPCKSWRLPG